MTFSNFVALLIAELTCDERFRSGAICRSTLHSVYDFRDVLLAPLEEVFNPAFLIAYQNHLLSKGCMRNTASFYMRAMRSMYNKAVARKLLPDVEGLFDQVFTGIDPTEKRALPPDVLFCILEADLSDDVVLNRTRNLFALAFLLHGMPFIDLMYLRKTDVQGSNIVYRRQKTKGVVVVPISDEARRIIDKLAEPNSTSPYLLPFITGQGEEARHEYENILRNQNRNLKELAKKLDITERLTTHVARHTWATIAYHAGIEVPVIGQALGHHDPAVTLKYLKSFDAERLRLAGRVVLDVVYRRATGPRYEREKTRHPSTVKRRTP